MPSPRPTVLLVDADPDRLAPFVDSFEAAGCRVAARMTAGQAVEDLGRLRADAVLWWPPDGAFELDNAVPAMRRASPTTRIVVVDPESGNPPGGEVRRVGADAFVPGWKAVEAVLASLGRALP
jgi:hypothetical protein